MKPNIEIEHAITHSGIDFNYHMISENHLHIDRFYIHEGYRNKGLATQVIKGITSIADRTRMTLTASILPDIQTDEQYTLLRTFFGKFGFIPEVMDGEIYRNDIIRKPYLDK